MALQDLLVKWGASQVQPIDLYSNMFCLGTNRIQRRFEHGVIDGGDYKPNPIGYWKMNDAEHGKFRIFFEDTFEVRLKELQEADFAILNGIAYYGKRNRQAHAGKMYGMIFDIDGITERSLGNFLSGALQNVDSKLNTATDKVGYPVPNYIVLSGHGIHLYYLFETPVPLFPYTKLQLKELKYALINRMWNPYTSTEKKIQYQGINQGFRVVGGKTKPDCSIERTEAFLVRSEKYTLEELNCYVPRESRLDMKKIFKESKISLAEAKLKYPKWYEKVIVRGDHQPKKWDISGKVHGDDPYALYHWWIDKIREGASFRHRYFCIMVLAIYAAKCDVPQEKLEEDAKDLIGFMNSLVDVPFTQADVDSALECYDDKFATFPIREIEKISAISIPRNRRNGRKQKIHLERARILQRYDDPEGKWRNLKGGKSAQDNVQAWCSEHPEGTIKECCDELKISYPTAVRWWTGKTQKRGHPLDVGKKGEIVEAWCLEHPTGTKAECIRETGLSKPTVYKWWAKD